MDLEVCAYPWPDDIPLIQQLAFSTPAQNPSQLSNAGWTITDNAGGTTGTRTHHVYFRPNVTDPNSPYFSYHVDKVKLGAFGGTTATYQFAYAFPRVHRSYLDKNNSPCEWLNDGVGCNPPQDRVPFLSSVSLPDGSRFSMPDYYLDASSVQDGPNTPGILKKLVLPTGGAIGWEHQQWKYAATEHEPPPCHYDGVPPNDCLHHLSISWSGIKKRYLFESPTATSPFATWTYSTATADAMPPPQDGHFMHINRERRVVVVDPNSNASVYYFAPRRSGCSNRSRPGTTRCRSRPASSSTSRTTRPRARTATSRKSISRAGSRSTRTASRAAPSSARSTCATSPKAQ